MEESNSPHLGNMRTTTKHLEGSLQTLNEMLGRPLTNRINGEFVSGHFSYENWGGGYFITESEGSGIRHLSPTGTLREAHAWVCAVIKGVQLSQGQDISR